MNHQNNIDAGLSVLVLHAQPQQTLIRKDIAEVCGCSDQYIRELEKKALDKIKKNPYAQRLYREM